MQEEKEFTGQFAESVYRNGNKIKKDRATAIIEDAALMYKREVEDLDVELKKLNRERAGELDLSPTDINSLILVNNFEPKKFVATDLELTLRIRNTKIKLEEALARYEVLFGEKLPITF